jgi:hypothetical protein
VLDAGNNLALDRLSIGRQAAGRLRGRHGSKQALALGLSSLQLTV